MARSGLILGFRILALRSCARLLTSETIYALFCAHVPIFLFLDPAQSVKAAMNQIQTMERLKVAATDEAEAAKIKQVKRAEAAGESTRIDASAQSEATYLSGVGMARQRHAILEGMKADVDAWSEIEGMEPQSVVAIMLQSQYYGALTSIGESPGTQTLFIPSDPSSAGSLNGQLRDSMLMSSAAGQRSALTSPHPASSSGRASTPPMSPKSD